MATATTPTSDTTDTRASTSSASTTSKLVPPALPLPSITRPLSNLSTDSLADVASGQKKKKKVKCGKGNNP
ncbi:hypothetical protein C0991_003200, partial [Blastosporella zonata]